MSSTQVSSTSKILDEEVEPLRNRDVGVFQFVILDAGFQKPRVAGIASAVAVLTAVCFN